MIGHISKRAQREQARKARQAARYDLEGVFAEHERRVKEFLNTAGQQTISDQKQRKADSLMIQESDAALFRVCHSTGTKKKNLAQIEGDEE